MDAAPPQRPDESLSILPGPPCRLGEELLALTVASQLDDLPGIIARIADTLLNAQVVAPSERAWLELCLTEALTNAMLHGNEGDPELPVAITVALTAREVVITISDQGDGFSASAVPGVDAAATCEHGRGIRLMRSWLEELRYHDGGATAVLVRGRDDARRG